MSTPRPWDDTLMDAIALTEAIRRDDESTAPGIRAILRHGNSMHIAVTLAKLLAVICQAQELDPVDFRRWSADAVREP